MHSAERQIFKKDSHKGNPKYQQLPESFITKAGGTRLWLGRKQLIAVCKKQEILVEFVHYELKPEPAWLSVKEQRTIRSP